MGKVKIHYPCHGIGDPVNWTKVYSGSVATRFSSSNPLDLTSGAIMAADLLEYDFLIIKVLGTIMNGSIYNLAYAVGANDGYGIAGAKNNVAYDGFIRTASGGSTAAVHICKILCRRNAEDWYSPIYQDAKESSVCVDDPTVISFSSTDTPISGNINVTTTIYGGKLT